MVIRYSNVSWCNIHITPQIYRYYPRTLRLTNFTQTASFQMNTKTRWIIDFSQHLQNYSGTRSLQKKDEELPLRPCAFQGCAACSPHNMHILSTSLHLTFFIINSLHIDHYKQAGKVVKENVYFFQRWQIRIGKHLIVKYLPAYHSALSLIQGKQWLLLFILWRETLPWFFPLESRNKNKYYNLFGFLWSIRVAVNNTHFPIN